MMKEQPNLFENGLDIDGAEIAVLKSGDRIYVYPGEGFNADCFAGEKLNPTEKEWRLNSHISSLWLRSKVVRLEGRRPCPR